MMTTEPNQEAVAAEIVAATMAHHPTMPWHGQTEDDVTYVRPYKKLLHVR